MDDSLTDNIKWNKQDRIELVTFQCTKRCSTNSHTVQGQKKCFMLEVRTEIIFGVLMVLTGRSKREVSGADHSLYFYLNGVYMAYAFVKINWYIYLAFMDLI